MKTNILLIVILSILIFIPSILYLIWNINTGAQINNQDIPIINRQKISKTQNGKYIYPVRPGTLKWGELNSRQEMVEVLQIPDEVLQVLSTKSLVQTVLDYPLLEDYLAYSNPPKTGPQNRFEFLSQEFNGYKVLIARKDAFTELKDIYLSKGLLSHEEIWKQINDPNCNCESINSINSIEYTLSQNYFLDKASEDELKSILVHAQTIMVKKLNSEDYGVGSSHSTAFLISRILSKTHNNTCSELLKSKDISYLMEKGEFVGVEGKKVYLRLSQCHVN
jgi:hypothetical protein